ncbi:uncharacterized protein Dwil_GK28002 [Drosophila willistoni]|nr:uncharacterized protein Dwil_GK28002 [Drosophila willistoni]
MECKVLDPAYLNFTRCELKPVSRGVKEIFVDVKLFQKPVDNVTHDLVVSGLRVDDDTNLRLPIEKGNYAFYLYWSVYNVMRSIVKTYVQLVD